MSKGSKYVDITSIIQVIGNIYKNPRLLDNEDQYNITEEDFPDTFHKVVFGSIYNLWLQGVEKITINNISDYLSSRPKSLAIYEANKGNELFRKNWEKFCTRWQKQIEEDEMPKEKIKEYLEGIIA